MRTWLVVLAVLLIGGLTPVSATSSTGSGITAINSATARQSTHRGDIGTVSEASQVLHFDADKATAEWMAMLSPDATTKSNAYFEGGYWLILWDFVVAMLLAWFLLETKLSARIRDLAERITRFAWLQIIIYGAQYIILTTVLTMPWVAYEGYFREHQYGMSNQSFGSWIDDRLKVLIITLILGTVTLVAIYAVIRKAPRTWWLWGSVVALALVVFSLSIAPVYLAPAFNKFYSLPDTPLKQQILSMAQANEIPATDVYEYDASKQTKRMSAYVGGLFGTTRISLNDNLMNRGSPEEIEAVMGHEMGHYVLNHVYKDMVYFSILLFLGFSFVQWSFTKLQACYGERWGIRGAKDTAGLPLLIALFLIYGFVMMPVNNGITRAQEAEADAFGLNAARQPDGFAQAAIDAADYRKMKPGPIEEWLFYNHPSGFERIHRAMVWKAEHINDCDIAAYDMAHPRIQMPPKMQ